METCKIDAVNPPHYKQGKIETIDIILDITKNLPGDQAVLVGNIIKYICRYYYKNGVEDVEKARWYIDKLRDLVEGEEVYTLTDDYWAEVSE